MTYAANLHIEDPVWYAIRQEARQNSEREPLLASFYHATTLNHALLEDALSFNLAHKLGNNAVSSMSLREVIGEAYTDDCTIRQSIRADLRAVRERDPACSEYLIPLLYFKGFQALQAYRIAHWLWEQERIALALYLQSRISEVWAVDIHPAARIGKGIMIDHATSLVIGETAVVEDDVSILHEVTLGGTGKESGDRHPKVRYGVLIGAGAKILGNVEIGCCSKVGAGSVVLDNVPAHSTVAGVPARVVKNSYNQLPARDMDHRQGLCCEGKIPEFEETTNSVKK